VFFLFYIQLFGPIEAAIVATYEIDLIKFIFPIYGVPIHGIVLID
jgi:hypothetical protein